MINEIKRDVVDGITGPPVFFLLNKFQLISKRTNRYAMEIRRDIAKIRNFSQSSPKGLKLIFFNFKPLGAYDVLPFSEKELKSYSG